MKFVILTLFPEMYDSFLNSSIIKRAIAKNLIEIKLVNIRDYTKNKYHRVDSPPVGGGPGLIMMCQPIIDALKNNSSINSKRIVLAPRGKVFNQKMAYDLSKEDEIILLCGHYEGIDERVYDYFNDTISIGDFVLTGGETASFVIIDAVSRLVNGVINEDSIKEESFSNNLLEYPQYAEPYEFDKKYIPDILYSGNHKAIRKYNLKESLRLTIKYRKDLLNEHSFNKEEKALLNELEKDEMPKRESEAIIKGKKFIKTR